MSLLLTRMFEPRSTVAALQETIGMLRRHRELVVEMTRRELLDRYAGNALGGIWAVAAPLLILGANVFALMYIFRIRFSETDIGGMRYAIFILAGMTPWLAMSDAIGRASTVIVNSANLVKQIVFPSEILPIKLVFATLPSLFAGIFVVFVLNLVSGNGSLFGYLVLLPLCLVYYLVLVTGFVYALAALGVFLRDIRDVTAVILSVSMFLHPIYYPPGAAPRWLGVLFGASPFSHMIWCFHDALFYGQITRPWSWVICPIVSVFLLSLGWRIFRTLRPTFGNAL